MAQDLPVVRNCYWPALLPQGAVVLVLWLIVHAMGTGLHASQTLVVAAVIYWGFCKAMRAVCVRDYSLGIRAYRARRLEEALRRFEASETFFTRHPLLDRNRAWCFGVASQNPYRTVAVSNQGYCAVLLGDREKARERFQAALALTPDYANAEMGLKMLGEQTS